MGAAPSHTIGLCSIRGLTLVDNGTTPSTQYHRCLSEEVEALGCAYGRSIDMVSIAQLAVEGNPQQLEPALFLNVPIQEGELGESWCRMPPGDTHQLRFRWLKGHPPLPPPPPPPTPPYAQVRSGEPCMSLVGSQWAGQ